MIWKCEVHIGLACLYDIKAFFTIILNVSSFKIHRVLLIYSKNCPIARRDGGNFLSRVVLKFRTPVSLNP